MMFWGGIAYGVFQKLVPNIGDTAALIVAIPIALLGVFIALVRVSEMTFLPVVLSMIRLSLNSKSRMWSVGTDSYSDLEIGYVTLPSQKAQAESNKSIEAIMHEDAQVSEKILKL